MLPTHIFSSAVKNKKRANLNIRMPFFFRTFIPLPFYGYILLVEMGSLFLLEKESHPLLLLRAHLMNKTLFFESYLRRSLLIDKEKISKWKYISLI